MGLTLTVSFQHKKSGINEIFIGTHRLKKKKKLEQEKHIDFHIKHLCCERFLLERFLFQIIIQFSHKCNFYAILTKIVKKFKLLLF